MTPMEDGDVLTACGPHGDEVSLRPLAFPEAGAGSHHPRPLAWMVISSSHF